jgi:penicillin-binding protein 1C
MIRARWFFVAAVALWAAAFARDRFDLWIADTDLPPLVIATSPEVTDHIRSLTVAGVWPSVWARSIPITSPC